jgi:hypothetical protein
VRILTVMFPASPFGICVVLSTNYKIYIGSIGSLNSVFYTSFDIILTAGLVSQTDV